MQTDFDWKSGIIDNKVIYACKYFMVKGHWQILNWENDRENAEEGAYEAVELSMVPSDVLKTALKASKVIGDGLYGVDIKYVNSKAYVIEVNDNPNIDYMVEDAVYGESLYQKIIESFFNRLENNYISIRNVD